MNKLTRWKKNQLKLKESLWAKKGYKAFYNMAAKQAGLSLNEFIITAIEEKMKNETPEIYNDMIQQQEKTNLEQQKGKSW